MKSVINYNQEQLSNWTGQWRTRVPRSASSVSSGCTVTVDTSVATTSTTPPLARWSTLLLEWVWSTTPLRAGRDSTWVTLMTSLGETCAIQWCFNAGRCLFFCKLNRATIKILHIGVHELFGPLWKNTSFPVTWQCPSSQKKSVSLVA